MTMEIAGTGLEKRFETEDGGTVVALRNIDFAVEQGHFFILVGDSGSGKTTLLRSVAGPERPEKGEIELRGDTVFSTQKGIYVPPQGRPLGMVFQSYAIWPHLTVYENIALPLREGRKRYSSAEVHSRVADALETVGLEALANRPAPHLSGGQQQRVALARAIAVSSSILLMDEPMRNLDARLREEVRNQIKRVTQHYNTTVIYVTHNQVEAMSLADQLALMRNGEILQRGRPENLYNRSTSIEIAEFFGPMNLVEGEAVGEGKIKTPIGLFEVNFNNCMDKKVLIGLRPEQMGINTSSTREANQFDAIITDRIFLGGSTVYEMDCRGVAFRLESTQTFAVDDRVRIEFPADMLRVFPFDAARADGKTGTVSTAE